MLLKQNNKAHSTQKKGVHPLEKILISTKEKPLPLVTTLSEGPSEGGKKKRKHTLRSPLARTPLGLCWRLESSDSPVRVRLCACGVGVSVRARGLCDISRLPIWLGEWTPSNYSFSYCLINLPVSLLHPLNTHPYLFSSFSANEPGKEKNKTIEWQDNTNQSRFLKSPSNSPVLMHSEGNYETDFLKEKSLIFFDQMRKKFTYSLFRLDRW